MKGEKMYKPHYKLWNQSYSDPSNALASIIKGIKEDEKYRIPKNFMEDALVIFSKVPLQRNRNGKISFSLISDWLNNKGVVFESKNAADTIIEGPVIKSLIQMLSLRNRSTMGQEESLTNYSIPVPLFMAAHKKYNNVMYEEWDKTDDKINWAMCSAPGKGLSFLPGFDMPEVEYNLILKDPELSKLRIEAVTTHGGKQYPLDGWYLNKKVLSNMNEIAVRMLLQLWQFNAGKRHELMILDPYNWDKVPPALDAEVPAVVPKTRKPRAVTIMSKGDELLF